jgi:serine/threonine protein phosphatase PrpC
MERLAKDWQAGADIRDLVRQISTDAREVFFATAGEQPRYAWPLAAFAALHTTEQGVTFTGLGDSAVYLLHDDGRSEFLAARPDAFEREQAAARAHLERIGGMGGASSIVNDPETLVDLRKSRELQNTPGGRGWSFGMVPEVADHLTSLDIAISGGATAIICSDGLVDLVSLYQAYNAGSLIRRAATAGLRSLVAELRRFEREIDPNALQYPRFKQSDDTTALLLRVERG